MRAYLFPGQGSQFMGMGKDLYDNHDEAKQLFELANDIIGFRITNLMFSSPEELLQETKVAQPAIFIHSAILAAIQPNFVPAMVAGHSLGEYAALFASQVFTFEDGLRLVIARSLAMQEACAMNKGTMAAIIGMPIDTIQTICQAMKETVVVANYNCPGQVVISGTEAGVNEACEVLKERGAKKIVLLKVGGAFHSPLMAPAQEILAKKIAPIEFKTGICPIFQNVTNTAIVDTQEIKKNLIMQLTAPIDWPSTIVHMVQTGASEFNICGPGKVLQGLVSKIDGQIPIKTVII